MNSALITIASTRAIPSSRIVSCQTGRCFFFFDFEESVAGPSVVLIDSAFSLSWSVESEDRDPSPSASAWGVGSRSSEVTGRD